MIKENNALMERLEGDINHFEQVTKEIQRRVAKKGAL